MQLSKLSGCEIAELDIVATADGVYLPFHPGQEQQLFGEDFDIRDLTFEELETHKLINAFGSRTTRSLESLKELIIDSPQDLILQFDKSWNYWPEFLEFLDQFADTHKKRFLLKSEVTQDDLDKLSNHPEKYMYMGIVSTKEELNLLVQAENINIIGVEILASSPEDDLYGADLIQQLQDEKGWISQINTIQVNDTKDLYAGLDDHVALFDSPDKVWGKLTSMGARIIQTDWPEQLFSYRSANN